MSRGIIPISAVGLFDDLSFNIKGSKEIFKKQILLLGHSYNIYDEYINMNVASKLKKEK